jgi:chitodextrinase
MGAMGDRAPAGGDPYNRRVDRFEPIPFPMRSPLATRARGAGLLAILAAGCDTGFSPVSGGSSQTTRPPLEVVSIDPAAGRTEVGPASTFRVRFSSTVDPSSLGASPITFSDLGTGGAVAGASRLEEQGKALVFTPATAPLADTRYCLALSPDIRSEDGGEIEVPSDPAAAQCAAVYDTFVSPPVLEGDVTAEAASSSSLRATWTAARDEDPAAVVYELFVRRAADPVPVLPEKTSPPGATTDLVTGLLPATAYLVSLRARDRFGNPSALSAEAAATTFPSDDREPPDFDGITELTALSPTVLRAGWGAATDAVDPQDLLRYRAYVALDAGGQDFDVIGKETDQPGVTTLEIDGLAPDTTYHVVVRAVDTANNEDANTEELSATTPLSFATNVLPILTRLDQGACSQPACHAGPRPDGGLNLSSYDGLMRGGVTTNPPAVVPGNGKGSYLLWRTDAANPNYQAQKPRMPQGRRPLTALQLSTIERWIDQGAIDN